MNLNSDVSRSKSHKTPLYFKLKFLARQIQTYKQHSKGKYPEQQLNSKQYRRWNQNSYNQTETEVIEKKQIENKSFQHGVE